MEEGVEKRQPKVEPRYLHSSRLTLKPESGGVLGPNAVEYWIVEALARTQVTFGALPMLRTWRDDKSLGVVLIVTIESTQARRGSVDEMSMEIGMTIESTVLKQDQLVGVLPFALDIKFPLDTGSTAGSKAVGAASDPPSDWPPLSSLVSP